MKPLSFATVLLFAATSALQAASPDSVTAYRRLVESSMTGDLAGMQAAVRDGAPLRSPGGENLLPLQEAIAANQMESLKWLLANGGQGELRRSTGKPLLTFALENGRENAARILIDAGADVRDRGEVGWGWNFAPAKAALETGSRQMLEEFERRGVDFSKPLPSGQSPLLVATLQNNRDAVEFLLERGANPKARLSDGNYPIGYAALVDNPELTALFLKHGADPNAIHDGTPIIHAHRRTPHTALLIAVRYSLVTPSENPEHTRDIQSVPA